MGGRRGLVGAKNFAPGSASSKAPRSFAAGRTKDFLPLQPAVFFFLSPEEKVSSTKPKPL
jgi:hypothetical protein